MLPVVDEGVHADVSVRTGFSEERFPMMRPNVGVDAVDAGKVVLRPSSHEERCERRRRWADRAH